MPGSTRSSGSRPSSGAPGRLLRGSSNSYVDETLFGSPTTSSKKASQAPGSPTLGRHTSSPPKTAPAGRGSPAGKGSPAAALLSSGRHDALTISKSQLERMLQASPILTSADLEAKKKEAEAKMEEEMAKSKARRQLMQQMEEDTKKVMPPSEMQKIRDKEAHETIARAQRAMLERKDEVKMMNQMILYANCMAVRDQQVAEKALNKLAHVEEDRSVHEEMEKQRQAALQELEEHEKMRAHDRKKGAAMLLEQLAEREQQRIRAEQLRRIEGEEMARRIEQLKLEEQKGEEERKAAAKALLEEVAQSNKRLELRKIEMRQAEAEEDQRIAEYIRLKDSRELEISEERERLAKQKELEVARLRAMQEKLQDTQSAQDEERAKRYQDECELAMRRKQQQQLAKQEAIMRDLEAARVSQMAWKEAQKQQLSKVEFEEFQRVMRAKQEADETERRQEIKRLEAQHKYQQRILAQIEAHQDKKTKEKQELQDEGRRIRERLAQEKALLLAIKEEKLKEMEALGVPDKYKSQLARLKPGKF